MKTITLLNEKGGVGKTTLAVHIAAGLALRGHRVMLIDGDAQGHATIRTGMPKAPALYDLLVRDAEWIDSAVTIDPARYGIVGERLPQGTLNLLAGNKETRSIISNTDRATIMRERLDELEAANVVDVVIIDTSPTPSQLHALFYTASDGIIMPTELAYSSFDGLVESIRSKQGADAGRERYYGLPPLHVVGIIPTKYRKATLEQADNLQRLREQFGRAVWEPLALRTVWTETEPSAQPVWALDPYGEATVEFWNVLDRVEGFVGEVTNVTA
jgi:chromosome partitioning protein